LADDLMATIGPAHSRLPPDVQREILARLIWTFLEAAGEPEEAPRLLGELISTALEQVFRRPGMQDLVGQQMEAIRMTDAFFDARKRRGTGTDETA
jgi:hypothetical protein